MVDTDYDSSPALESVSSEEENILRSERFWFAIDRQLLASGLRLILILPAFSFLTYF